MSSKPAADLQSIVANKNDAAPAPFTATPAAPDVAQGRSSGAARPPFATSRCISKFRAILRSVSRYGRSANACLITPFLKRFLSFTRRKTRCERPTHDATTTTRVERYRKELAPDAFLLSGASFHHLARPYGIPAGDVRGF